MPGSSLACVKSLSRKEIIALIKSARVQRRIPGLDIKAAPKGGATSHLLIIISAKVAIAPLRNLIRRRLKALFYEEKLFLHSSHDWVIYVKKEALSYSYQELKSILLPIFSHYKQAAIVTD